MSAHTSSPEISKEILLVLDLLQRKDTNRLADTGGLFIKRSISGTLPVQREKTLADPLQADPYLPDLEALQLGDKTNRFTLTEHLSRGSLGSIYRGTFDGAHHPGATSSSMIVKLVAGEDKLVFLRHEAVVYQHVKHLQGRVLPRCYGFYENEKRTTGFILLEDCGSPYKQPFEGLSDGTKLALMRAIKQLHDSGIEHGDLQPWNVLDHRGLPCIVDWHLGMIHKCPAKNQTMTEEFCFREAISEFACEELVTVGERMLFPSQDVILYG